MRFIVLFFMVSIFTSKSHSSTPITFCSNAEQTIRYEEDREGNFTFTERKWENNLQVEDRYSISVFEIEEESTDSVALAEEVENSCTTGVESGGVLLTRRYWATKTTLRKKNGSLFTPFTVGVSKDLKSVTTRLMCQKQIYTLVLCN